MSAKIWAGTAQNKGLWPHKGPMFWDVPPCLMGPTLHPRPCHVFKSFSFETTATPIWWWVRVIHPVQVILSGILPMWSYPRQALLQYYCKWFGRFIPKDTFDILNKYGMTCANIEYLKRRLTLVKISPMAYFPMIHDRCKWYRTIHLLTMI